VLTVQLDSLVNQPAKLDMIELTESGERLLPGGQLILDPVRVARVSSTSTSVGVVLSEFARRKSCDSKGRLSRPDEPTNLRLALFLKTGETRRESKQHRGATSVRTIYERTLALPRLAMYVPKSLVHPAVSDGQSDERRPMIRRAFVLPQRVSRLQVSSQTGSGLVTAL
jgi:hypothetical protein